jgi:hypothetical protein
VFLFTAGTLNTMSHSNIPHTGVLKYAFTDVLTSILYVHVRTRSSAVDLGGPTFIFEWI